jgi:hypothetical protein
MMVDFRNYALYKLRMIINTISESTLWQIAAMDFVPPFNGESNGAG